MNGTALARQFAERRIRRACRRLSGETRDERYREWSAELPAILGDPDGGGGFLPAARALRYAAGFVLICLVDLVRASEVRYLPKWAWALACMLWIPLGGIMYFSVGRASGPRRRGSHQSS